MSGFPAMFELCSLSFWLDRNRGLHRRVEAVPGKRSEGKFGKMYWEKIKQK